jgi:4-hydroxy-4-methyl-2-oxoglutarate aldolase
MDRKEQDEITRRLLALDTGLISDVMDEAGLPGHALAADIVGRAGPKKVAGPAVCVVGGPIVPGGNSRKTMDPGRLEEAMEEGAILVLASQGMRVAAPIGGLVSRSLQMHGCAGIVTDAAVRDLDEIDGLALPVFAAGTSPVNAGRIWQFIEPSQTASLPTRGGGNIAVKAGDFLLGDREGVVVIPASSARGIVEDAEELQRIEARITEAISGGETRKQAFIDNPRFKHIRASQ